MDVSIAQARNRLTELIRAVEDGEQVIITRNGKPMAQSAPPHRPSGRFGWGRCADRFTSNGCGYFGTTDNWLKIKYLIRLTF